MKRTEIERAVGVLRAGGLVAFPTETVYGLGARALDPRALMRIFAAKGRPSGHPLIAHVLGVDDARSLTAQWPVLASRLAAAFWPGPLTLVLPRAPHVPLELTGGGASVGVRAPAHAVARELLEALGEPIAAPSANRYQSISPTTAAHVARSLGDAVDMILDGGPCSAGIESTVVDLRGEAPVILRPGALDLPTLAAVAPEISERGDVVLEDDLPHVSPGLDRRHYAPRTPLLLVADQRAAVAEARERLARGERIALLLIEPLDSSLAEAFARTHVRSLGSDAEGYARGLFAALHDLDAESVAAIVVQRVPDTPPWRAVADRLRRASAVAAADG